MVSTLAPDLKPAARTAVVFAYHNVGVRCLKVLLAQGVNVSLVLTHEDNPTETIWFESVAELCREHGIPYETPSALTGVRDGVDQADYWQARLASLAPDFIFSFYYRNMLPMTLLATAKHGAFNMHGSLLPTYRGRVPVNWAIVRGETRTGATLHHMVEKPDAGDIVAQQAVPILPDDTAHEVFNKVCLAAEITLDEVLPLVLTGRAPRLPNDLSKGSYFGGRKAEDGRIDPTQSAAHIYNLIRAVAPPYPGAYLDVEGKQRIWVDGAKPVRLVERLHQLNQEWTVSSGPDSGRSSQTAASLLHWQGEDYLRGADGAWLKLVLRA
jgi:methionyl-tRNA formyltransferase